MLGLPPGDLFISNTFWVGAYSRGVCKIIWFVKLFLLIPHKNFIVKTLVLHNIKRTIYIEASVYIKVFIILCGGDLFEGDFLEWGAIQELMVLTYCSLLL